MSTIVFKINGSSGDTIRLLFDDGTATPPFIQWNGGTGAVEFSNDGDSSVAIASSSGAAGPDATWEAPMRCGELRIWPHTTNQVMMYKYGSAPTSMTDGYEFMAGSPA